MKSTYLLIPIVCLTLLLSCYDEKPREANNSDTRTTNTATFSSTKIPDLSSDFLVSVYEKQELIKISQEDKELRKNYCDDSYLEKEKLFISMGIGTLTNPKTGEPISHNLAERAANIDARRWASYGELWLTNNYEPPFGKLTRTFNRTVTVINKSVVGDSLFIFVATSLP
jgi:hypothetical protein